MYLSERTSLQICQIHSMTTANCLFSVVKMEKKIKTKYTKMKMMTMMIIVKMIQKLMITMVMKKCK